MSSSYPGYGNSTIQRCQRCGMPLSPISNGYCGNCGMQNAPSQPNTASGQLPFTSNTTWGGQSQPLQGNSQPGQSGQFGQFGTPQSGLTPSGGFSSSALPPQQPFGNASSPLQSPFQPQQFAGGPPVSQPLSNSSQSYAPQGTFNVPSAPLQPFGSGQYQQQPFNTQGFSSPNGFASTASSPSQPDTPLYQSPSYNNNFPSGNMNGYNPNNFSDPNFSDERKKPKVGLIIGSVLLLLLLIGGGIGGYMILKSHKSSTTGVTQSVTPTATPKGPPLFSDTFQNNNKGWDLSSMPGEYSVAVGGGSLALEDDHNRLLWELVPGGKTYDNFLLNVDAVLSKGTQDNGYGIYIRGASNQAVDIATYYRFELYGDGSFAIFKGTLDASGTSQSSNLVNNTLSSAILKQGQVNHISIVASGSTMSLIVNGQLVKTITDNSYTSGSIALFVSNLANAPAGAQAKFSNLAIYPPQQ